ncbi:MAG: hypothetical protein ACK5ZS_01245 [bacterium]|jgi:hypothetical protein
MIISTLGGRRFILTLGCGIVCTGLVIAGTIDPTTFRDIILGTVAAYIAGNTWQKHAEARTEPLKGDAA